MEGDGSTPTRNDDNDEPEYMKKMKRSREAYRQQSRKVMIRKGYIIADDIEFLDAWGFTRQRVGLPDRGIWSTDRELKDSDHDIEPHYQPRAKKYYARDRYIQINQDESESFPCFIRHCWQEAHDFCERCENYVCPQHVAPDAGPANDCCVACRNK